MKKKFKIGKRTKILKNITLVFLGATVISQINDHVKFDKAKNRAFSTQTFYIETLENFIKDLIGEEEFLHMIGEAE